MRLQFETQDLLSGGLGLLAGVLGVVAARGVLQPPEEGLASSVLVTAVIGVVIGIVGLTVGRTRGVGRQVASIGTGIALVGLLLYGGSIALDALLEASNS